MIPMLLDQHKRQNQDAGRFCLWVLHGMRHRALERMEQILAESGVDVEASLMA